MNSSVKWSDASYRFTSLTDVRVALFGQTKNTYLLKMARVSPLTEVAFGRVCHPDAKDLDLPVQHGGILIHP